MFVNYISQYSTEYVKDYIMLNLYRKRVKKHYLFSLQ